MRAALASPGKADSRYDAKLHGVERESRAPGAPATASLETAAYQTVESLAYDDKSWLRIQKLKGWVQVAAPSSQRLDPNNQ